MKTRVSQKILNSKIRTFLSALGERDFSEMEGGMCNAYAFMNFRADRMGEIKVHQTRMEKLANTEDADLKQMAKYYQLYQKDRQVDAKELRVIRNQYNQIDKIEGRIKTLEDKLKRMEKTIQLSTLKQVKLTRELELWKNILPINQKIKKYEDQLASNPKSDPGISRLIEELLSDRDKVFDRFIEDPLQKKYSATWDWIQNAKELYIYAHSLLAASNPGKTFGLHIDEKPVSQSDYLSLLKLLPIDHAADMKTVEQASSIKKTFELSYSLMGAEWEALLRDQLTSMPVYMKVASLYHAMYISIDNGKIRLYNPDLVKESDISRDPGLCAKTVLELISPRFYQGKAFSLSEPMSIAFDIYQRETEKKHTHDNPMEMQHVVSKLLDKRSAIDANINASDARGVTAIMISAARGDLDLVKLCISFEADVNIASKEIGFTPLHIASQNGHSTVVNVLAANGAHIDQRDAMQRTPLCIAALLGRTMTIQTLIEYGASINTQDGTGFTPLHHAAKSGHYDVITTLLQNGANPFIKNNENQTPIEVSDKNTQACILLTMLEQHIKERKLDSTPLAAEHLVMISNAKKTNDWDHAAEAIFNRSKEAVRHSSSSRLFSKSATTVAPRDYLQQVQSKESLQAMLTKSISYQSPKPKG